MNNNIYSYIHKEGHNIFNAVVANGGNVEIKKFIVSYDPRIDSSIAPLALDGFTWGDLSTNIFEHFAGLEPKIPLMTIDETFFTTGASNKYDIYGVNQDSYHFLFDGNGLPIHRLPVIMNSMRNPETGEYDPLMSSSTTKSINVTSDFKYNNDTKSFEFGGIETEVTAKRTAFDIFNEGFRVSNEKAEMLFDTNGTTVNYYDSYLNGDNEESTTSSVNIRVSFNDVIGTLRYNKVVLFIRDVTDGSVNKDFIPFVTVIIPETQLKSNYSGQGVSELTIDIRLVNLLNGQIETKISVPEKGWEIINRSTATDDYNAVAYGGKNIIERGDVGGSRVIDFSNDFDDTFKHLISATYRTGQVAQHPLLLENSTPNRSEFSRWLIGPAGANIYGGNAVLSHDFTFKYKLIAGQPYHHPSVIPFGEYDLGTSLKRWGKISCKSVDVADKVLIYTSTVSGKGVVAAISQKYGSYLRLGEPSQEFIDIKDSIESSMSIEKLDLASGKTLITKEYLSDRLGLNKVTYVKRTSDLTYSSAAYLTVRDTDISAYSTAVITGTIYPMDRTKECEIWVDMYDVTNALIKSEKTVIKMFIDDEMSLDLLDVVTESRPLIFKEEYTVDEPVLNYTFTTRMALKNSIVSTEFAFNTATKIGQGTVISLTNTPVNRFDVRYRNIKTGSHILVSVE